MPALIRLGAPTAAALFLFSTLAHGTVVFSQRPVADEADVGLGFASHSAPTATNSFRHADTFRLAEGALLSSVRWWGAGEGDEGPDTANVAAFEITIYSHGGFFPDRVLHHERFAVGDTNPTATGRFGNGVNEHTHLADLTQAFWADADTTYWIAIAAELANSAGDAWLWGDARSGDGASASFRYSTGRWTSTSPYDSAFELISVPSPGTLPGLLLILAARRRAR